MKTNNSKKFDMQKVLQQITAFVKRFLSIIIVFVLGIFVVYACNKKCNCTDKPCPCYPFTISFFANADNGVEGSFTGQELNAFYLLRTNDTYAVIDSIKMDFHELFSNVDYNQIFEFSAENFKNVIDLRPFNFIIKNTILKTADTISSISYTESSQSVLCNVCTNCDDEYLDCVVFSDVRFDLDCCVQNNSEVILKK